MNQDNKDNKTEKTTEIIQADSTSTSNNSFLSHIPDLVNSLAPLVKSSNTRFKSTADLVLAAQWAKDAGVSFSSILNKGYVLNGRVGVEYPVLLAILASHGVIVTEIEDCRPLHTYSTKTFRIDQDRFDEEKDKYQVFGSLEEFKTYHSKDMHKKDKIHVIKSKEPYDYRTTLEARRVMVFNNRKEVIVKRASFTHSEAVIAELSERDTYVKYLKDMLMGKAVPRLCWRIASDLVHGAIPNQTLAEVNEVQYNYDDKTVDTNNENIEEADVIEVKSK